MSKRKIKVREILSRPDAIRCLKDLIKGLESGVIVVGEGESALSFAVGEDLKVSLKGKVKGAKVKVSVGLSWMEEQGEAVAVAEAEVPAKRAKAAPPATQDAAKTPAAQGKAKAPAKKSAAKSPAKKSAAGAAKKQ